MKSATRERLVLPLVIPLGAFAVIALLTIGFSRVLLKIPPQVATAVAIGAAANILIVAAIVAGRGRFTQNQFFALTTAAIIPVALGGAVAVGILRVSEPGHRPPETLPQLELSAANLLFDKSTLEASPGQQMTLNFTNNDAGIAHNVAIFAGADASAPNVFRGEIINGISTVNYHVPALDAGSYYFHCDVHPTTMTGALNVAEEAKPPEPPPGAASPPPGPGPASAESEVTAMNLVFEPKSLEFSSGLPLLIDFHNQDAGIPHNIAIFKGSNARGDVVFRGEVFAGVRTVSYQVPALQPGEYFFHCDVHPTTMTGTIQVV